VWQRSIRVESGGKQVMRAYSVIAIQNFRKPEGKLRHVGDNLP